MNYETGFDYTCGQVDAMAARTELLVPPDDILDRTVRLYRLGTRRAYNTGYPHCAS